MTTNTGVILKYNLDEKRKRHNNIKVTLEETSRKNVKWIEFIDNWTKYRAFVITVINLNV
jgi:hypothetical protein